MANSRFWGFLFGLATGAVIGALQAPRSGAETRARINQFVTDSTGLALDTVGLTPARRHEIQQSVGDVRVKTAAEVSTIVDKTTATIDRTARQVEEAASDTRSWAAGTAASVRARVGDQSANVAHQADPVVGAVENAVTGAAAQAGEVMDQASAAAKDLSTEVSDVAKDATS